MRVLITGAAGFIGSHLTDKLLAAGATVTGVDNFDPFYDPAMKRANLAEAMASQRFELVEADIAEADALNAALRTREFDVVVHMAAKAGVRPSILDPREYARVNVMGTQNVLDVARERGVHRFVFASSSSVYGNNPKVPFSEDHPVDRPISPYAATKRAGELLCHTYAHLFGMSVICLRFFTVYGPRQRPDLAIRKFTELMLRGEPIPFFGDGTTERDYTWIDDIIQGVTSAIDWTGAHPGEFEIVNLGESETTTLAKLVNLIGETLGVEAKIERLSMQAGDVERTYADISKAREVLGYRPETALEVGIQHFVQWIRL